MKKQQPTNRPVRSLPVGDNIDVELLFAAAEAHPAWQFCRTVVVLNAT
jgi:hypothetical protein